MRIWTRDQGLNRNEHDASDDPQRTAHALLEMRADRLDVIDVESAILTGIIEDEYHDDPRGVRYEVVGKACDLVARVGVIARFAGPLLIITVYEILE